MANKRVEVTPRSFNPLSVPGISSKAREAVNEVFEAMSNWRSETADEHERHSMQVIEKMAAAASALGWPEQIVEAARVQMQTIAEIQVQTIDQMMDVWEEQLKLPANSPPSAMLSKLKSMPKLGQAGDWPGAAAFQMTTMNPLQFWMQYAQQLQKSWQDTMTFWTNATKPHDSSGLRH